MKDQNKIVSNWINNESQPLVSIICTTFNHGDFIGETLKGFLIQETNFSFEIIVHDDASNDNTAAVIQEYADKYPLIIKPILQKENQYSQKVNIWSEITFPISRGKYIALCEGDDYWIDKQKLQKQVDFLENNSQYVITWTDYLIKKGSELEATDFKETLSSVYTVDFNTIFNPYCTYTLTSVFRKESVDFSKFKDYAHFKDNTLYSLALTNGKGAFMNFQGGVYRWHQGGIYSLKALFFQRYSSYLNIKEIFENIPQARTNNIKKVIASLLKASAFEALKLRRSEEFKNDEEPKKAVAEFLDKASLSLKIKYLWRYIKSCM
ncbi:glycosyltransferase family 2 protein [Flavobacterium gelatinilyticum]|uniref:glycosyltransferase family 2 protein n=1 Tax=Flavobacterium gelatinilyticum TaxID=3003260 RepID=UPI002480D0E5|nr:glycosyltransferase [Flavobacterium gelatinilyticum]